MSRRILALSLSALLGTILSCAQQEEPKLPVEAAPSAPAHVMPEHSFADVERWVRIFDSEDRDEWQMPVRVVEALRIGPGSVVADLGAGTGYFTVHLARAVSPGGRVLAIDTEPNLVDYLGKRAEHEGVEGVEPVLADPDDPRIPPGAALRVLVVNTYHHIGGRVDYLRRLQASLAEDGQVVVIDYYKKPLPVGPPLEQKLSRDDVVAEFQAAGYRLASEETFLPYQYFLSFAPDGE